MRSIKVVGAVHVVIPDTQVAPGVPTAHLSWAGRYIRDQFKGHPDLKVIHLGDHWTMESLSSYDRGKRSFASTNYADDVESGNKGMELLSKPLETVVCQKHILRGNHENRIVRAADDLDVPGGAVSFDHLLSPGWQIHDFLHVLDLDGVAYAHYFANPSNGSPFSGMVETRIKNVGRSFTQGHQQGLRYGMIDGYAGAPARHGLIAGSFYQHDESYRGPQATQEWRGIVVKHQVRNGTYDIMLVSLDYLCRRYEGVTFEEYRQETR